MTLGTSLGGSVIPPEPTPGVSVSKSSYNKNAVLDSDRTNPSKKKSKLMNSRKFGMTNYGDEPVITTNNSVCSRSGKLPSLG